VSEPTPGWPALGAPGAAGAGVIVEPPGGGDDDGGGGTVGDVPAGAGDVDVPPLLAPAPVDCAWTAPAVTVKARTAIKAFPNIRSSWEWSWVNRWRKPPLHGRAKS